MNRRNFLAFIPALSAVPIVGKHLETDKDKIVIYKPEDVLAYKGEDRFSPLGEHSLLVVDEIGKIVAVGRPFSIEHECPIYESSPLGMLPVSEGRLTLRADVRIIENIEEREFYNKFARQINFKYRGTRL